MSLTTIFLQIDVRIKAINTAIITLADEEMACENENKLVFDKECIHFLYCRFGNFCKNFIFTKCIKRHISDVKNSRLRHDLPISINDRVILPFREGFIFMFRRNKVLAKIYKSTVFKYNRQRLPCQISITDQIMCVSMNYEVQNLSRNVVCATSKGSDQPAHTRRLIRAFATHLNILTEF